MRFRGTKMQSIDLRVFNFDEGGRGILTKL